MPELRFAVRHTVPVFFTYLFIGIAFGVLMNESGYGIILTVASAVFIYAGSMQLAMVPLISSGASLITLALTAFFVNVRHIFYGIGLIDRFRRMGRRYPYMVFALTDETYSILCSIRYDDELDEDRCAFMIAFLNHLYWIFGCLIGVCAGTFLHFDIQGIGFSATAFFLVVVVEQWRNNRSKIPFMTALICALICSFLFGRDDFLIPALLSCLIAMIMLKKPFELKDGSSDE